MKKLLVSVLLAGMLTEATWADVLEFPPKALEESGAVEFKDAAIKFNEAEREAVYLKECEYVKNVPIPALACLQIGGHCWDEKSFLDVQADFFGVEIIQQDGTGAILRRCRHCGLRQSKRIVPAKEIWEDVKP